MRLGDCRGIVDAVNEACTCGGGGPPDCCPACEVWHGIQDMGVPPVAPYPEHNKLQSVKESSQIIRDFLSWLQGEQSVVLAKSHKHNANCVEDGDRVCGAENDQLVAVFRSIPRPLRRRHRVLGDGRPVCHHDER